VLINLGSLGSHLVTCLNCSIVENFLGMDILEKLSEKLFQPS